jgi:sortase A
MQYRIQVVGWALIWSGLFILGYLGWLLWGTDLVNAGIQTAASEQLGSDLAATDPSSEAVNSDDFLGRPSDLPETVEYFAEDAVGEGEPFAFLTIPALGLDGVVVYEGVNVEDLKKGPGHMPSTPLPGQPGNAVISGHRTTYGRPFFDFDLLAVGDRVEVESAAGTHVYAVREIDVVAPTDVWVINPRPGGWLTMTTCHPKFSARERLVVWAEMVDGPNLGFIELNKAKLAPA